MVPCIDRTHLRRRRLLAAEVRHKAGHIPPRGWGPVVRIGAQVFYTTAALRPRTSSISLRRDRPSCAGGTLVTFARQRRWPVGPHQGFWERPLGEWRPGGLLAHSGAIASRLAPRLPSRAIQGQRLRRGVTWRPRDAIDAGAPGGMQKASPAPYCTALLRRRRRTQRDALPNHSTILKRVRPSYHFG